MTKIIHYTLIIGDFLLYLFKLHILSIIHILRGGIIFGFFPSIISIWELYFENFKYKTYTFPRSFSKIWNNYIKSANFLGYFSVGFIVFFIFDIHLSINYLKNDLLSAFLLAILLIIIGWAMFLFPSLIRYNLTISQHIKQAFFLLLCSIPEFIAAILGEVCIIFIFIFFPILFLFGALPLLILPIAWFTYQAVIKLEKNQTNEAIL